MLLADRVIWNPKKRWYNINAKTGSKSHRNFRVNGQQKDKSVGLLWKEENIILPYNHSKALRYSTKTISQKPNYEQSCDYIMNVHLFGKIESPCCAS